MGMEINVESPCSDSSMGSSFAFSDTSCPAVRLCMIDAQSENAEEACHGAQYLQIEGTNLRQEPTEEKDSEMGSACEENDSPIHDGETPISSGSDAQKKGYILESHLHQQSALMENLQAENMETKKECLAHYQKLTQMVQGCQKNVATSHQEVCKYADDLKAWMLLKIQTHEEKIEEHKKMANQLVEKAQELRQEALADRGQLAQLTRWVEVTQPKIAYLENAYASVGPMTSEVQLLSQRIQETRFSVGNLESRQVATDQQVSVIDQALKVTEEKVVSQEGVVGRCVAQIGHVVESVQQHTPPPMLGSQVGELQRAVNNISSTMIRLEGSMKQAIDMPLLEHKMQQNLAPIQSELGVLRSQIMEVTGRPEMSSETGTKIVEFVTQHCEKTNKKNEEKYAAEMFQLRNEFQEKLSVHLGEMEKNERRIGKNGACHHTSNVSG